MAIHSTAVVDRTAEIDPSAEVGAYAVIERGVRIGPQARIYPHAFVGAGTTLEARCQVHPFAVVGHQTQDLKWRGADSYTVIGEGTVVREHATIHRGTEPESTTRVGRNCLIMSTAHIGHNCELGNHNIIANGALLAGHIVTADRVLVSGNVTVHQFVRIGELAMIAGLTRAPKDVPPFMLLAPDGITGPNVVGLRRAGLTSDERYEIRRAFRLLYRSGLHFPVAIERVAAMVETAPGQRLVAFLRAPSLRGHMAGRRRRLVTAAEAAEAEHVCES